MSEDRLESQYDEMLSTLRRTDDRLRGLVQATMERLRDVLIAQHSRIGCGSEDSEIQWDAGCKIAMEAGELITDEFAYMTEREIRNQMDAE